MSNNEKKRSRKRDLIEWGLIIGVIAFLYFSGLHTQVIGTAQRGLLSTGLIKPSIPETFDEFPVTSREFYFVNEDARMQSLADFEGDVIFMNIWATWCPPCIAEMPSIYSLYQQFSDDDNVTFLLVSVDEDFNKAKEFMEKRDYSIPIYHFRTKKPGTYDSSAIPTTYVITPNGKLALQKEGLAKYDTREFEQFLRDLAEE